MSDAVLVMTGLLKMACHHNFFHYSHPSYVNGGGEGSRDCRTALKGRPISPYLIYMKKESEDIYLYGKNVGQSLQPPIRTSEMS